MKNQIKLQSKEKSRIQKIKMNLWLLIKEYFGFYFLILFIPIIILYSTTRFIIYLLAWYSERKHQTKIKVGSVKFFQLDDITIQLSNGLTIVCILI